jgi:hypothetical protein
VRHSLRSEAVAILALYGLYELARGLVLGDAAEADRHARHLVVLEQSLHLSLGLRPREASVSRVESCRLGANSGRRI